MSANAAPLPNSPGPFPVEIPDAGTNSLWDRLSNWASENKGAVYAIAGVTLVVGTGGILYYLSDSNKDPSASAGSTKQHKKKRDRKKGKERADKDTTKEELQPGR